MEGTLEPEGWGLNPRYSHLSLKRMGQGMQSRALQVTLGTGHCAEREEPLLPPSHHPEALGAVGRPGPNTFCWLVGSWWFIILVSDSISSPPG